MKYAILFGVLSVAAWTTSFLDGSAFAAKLLFNWAAVAFAFVSIAYALGSPGLLMKRDDGSQPFVAWLIYWPYFVLSRFSFLLYRLLRRRAVPVAEAAPGVWFARRLTSHELRSMNRTWSGVLDLAAEFPRAPIHGAEYRSLPVLDGVAPSERQLEEGIRWLDEKSKEGDVLVHCALGHGRTGSIVLAWLLVHRHVPTLQEGVAHLVARRRTFGLSKAQAAAVERFVSGRSECMSSYRRSD